MQEHDKTCQKSVSGFNPVKPSIATPLFINQHIMNTKNDEENGSILNLRSLRNSNRRGGNSLPKAINYIDVTHCETHPTATESPLTATSQLNFKDP